jgi:hypothetical protein
MSNKLFNIKRLQNDDEIDISLIDEIFIKLKNTKY